MSYKTICFVFLLIVSCCVLGVKINTKANLSSDSGTFDDSSLSSQTISEVQNLASAHDEAASGGEGVEVGAANPSGEPGAQKSDSNAAAPPVDPPAPVTPADQSQDQPKKDSEPAKVDAPKDPEQQIVEPPKDAEIAKNYPQGDSDTVKKVDEPPKASEPVNPDTPKDPKPQAEPPKEEPVKSDPPKDSDISAKIPEPKSVDPPKPEASSNPAKEEIKTEVKPVSADASKVDETSAKQQSAPSQDNKGSENHIDNSPAPEEKERGVANNSNQDQDASQDFAVDPDQESYVDKQDSNNQSENADEQEEEGNQQDENIDETTGEQNVDTKDNRERNLLKKIRKPEDALDGDPEFEEAYREFKEFCEEEQDILDDINNAENGTSLLQVEKKFLEFRKKFKKEGEATEIHPKQVENSPKKNEIEVAPKTENEEVKENRVENNLKEEAEKSNEIQDKIVKFVKKQANLKKTN